MHDASPIDGSTSVLGRVRAHRVPMSRGIPYFITGWQPTTPWRPNLTVFEWASMGCRLFTAGDTRYRISGMYLEFANVAAPGDPVSIPTFNRTRNIDYYNALTGNVDYLRVPLTAFTVDSSDLNVYPNGNRMTFFARSAGLQGSHGLEFGYNQNSVIYGASLVALVHATDYTQDLVFASVYFPEGEQQPKLATSQVGLEWEKVLQ